uniref:Uncharacterized protein n=1 Tax=Romanomermis culicivorax TaxID=13658 RepID=A0A915KQ22_ROMCU
MQKRSVQCSWLETRRGKGMTLCKSGHLNIQQEHDVKDDMESICFTKNACKLKNDTAIDIAYTKDTYDSNKRRAVYYFLWGQMCAVYLRAPCIGINTKGSEV